MFVGDADASSESPAGGRGHDAEPAFPPEELRTELHSQDEDGSLGRRTDDVLKVISEKKSVLLSRWRLISLSSNSTNFISFSVFQVLCLNKDTSLSSDSTPSSVQVRKSSSSSGPTPRPSVSSDSPKPPSSTSHVPRSSSASAQEVLNRQKEADDSFRSPGRTDLGQGEGGGGGGGGHSLAETGRSTSNLAISGSQQYLAGGKEPTPSIASDISNPYAAQELQLRLQQLQKYLSISHLSVYLFIQRSKHLSCSCPSHSVNI